ncbi:hypothetical protein [Xanthomonas sp. 3058]|uniref:hypothetical protein n=1 Tax=Xanthomonas sp. 3058 TaxID=3035314 RepID=UPI0016101615|nr:hypothetical protein [Xanthomonas sp. 3058]MBB5866054.1 hypothetical protein [Xanthomonas sp. 3058]
MKRRKQCFSCDSTMCFGYWWAKSSGTHLLRRSTKSPQENGDAHNATQLWSDIALPAGKPILAVAQPIGRIAAVDRNACRMRVLRRHDDSCELTASHDSGAIDYQDSIADCIAGVVPNRSLPPSCSRSTQVFPVPIACAGKRTCTAAHRAPRQSQALSTP